MFAFIEFCFFFLPDDKVYRGCLSDKKQGNQICNQNLDGCMKCDETGCNKFIRKESDVGNASLRLPFWSFGIVFILAIICTVIGLCWMNKNTHQRAATNDIEISDL